MKENTAVEADIRTRERRHATECGVGRGHRRCATKGAYMTTTTMVTSARRPARQHGPRALLATACLAAAIVVGACGGSSDGPGASGTWVHPEEGTIVLAEDGSGSITQSSDPVEFEWSQDGSTIRLSFDGGDAVATQGGDILTFRAGDFSGDEPVDFTRE